MLVPYLAVGINPAFHTMLKPSILRHNEQDIPWSE